MEQKIQNNKLSKKYDFNELNIIIKDYWNTLAMQQGSSNS